MLRLTHTQATQNGVLVGALLVDDIDDGLPNKETHRMGSKGDPKSYPRDGYANAPKQSCYIPRNKHQSASDPWASLDAALPGFIDLRETEKVLLSAKNGKIAKFATAGLITVTSILKTSLNHPVITGTALVSDLTISGTGFTSTSPDVSSVIITGTGAVTLTRAQIITGGGTFTASSIVVPAALITGVVDGSVVRVRADGHASNAYAVGAVPVISSAALTAVNLTLAGTGFLSTAPAVSSLVIAGTGAVTLTRAQILTGGGTFTNTSIVVPVAFITGVTDPGSTATVSADGNNSNTVNIAGVPSITSAVLNTDLTLTGTFFDGVGATVAITGTGAVSLTKTQITGGGGTYTNTSVVIPAALIVGVTDPGSSVQVTADSQSSAVVAIVAKPVLTSAYLDTTLTLTGTFMDGVGAQVAITGAGAVTLTKAQIVAAVGGSYRNTSVVIPASLIASVAKTTSSAQVTADGQSSSVVVVTGP